MPRVPQAPPPGVVRGSTPESTPGRWWDSDNIRFRNGQIQPIGGNVALVNTATLGLHPWFAGLGPEPLSDAFDAAHLKAAFAGRKQGPKTLLLDQRVVAGLGNIYVCEALHRSGISPLRPGGEISGRELTTLVATVRLVLEEAIEAGGSTLRDYAGADGALGYFQHRFRAYDREGEPCTRSGCRGVIERTVQSGRSTFFCAACQR